MTPVHVIAGIVAVIAAGIVVAVVLERKRTEAMKGVAEGMGFTFYPKGDDSIRSRLPDFLFFSQGHSRRVRNMMHGVANEIECAIFEYEYSTGSCRSSALGRCHGHTWRQTVISFWSRKLNLPSFSLRPEHIFHKIGGLLGYQDIDFDGRPGFSSAYLLRAADEEAVRRVFTERVLSFYEAQKGLNTEGDGDCLIHYRASKRVKPEGIRAFMEEGFRTFGLFAAG